MVSLAALLWRGSLSAAPFAASQPATQITTNSAALNGMASPNGLPSSAWFEWGTTGVFGQTTGPQSVGSGFGVVSVSTNLGGLTRGQVLHFRLVVSNSFGVVPGAEQIFVVGGKVRAWGNNEAGQTNVPVGLNDVVQVGGGTWHSLALRADGAVIGWGGNLFGLSVLPVGVSNLTAIAAGADHGLGLRSNGTVLAWGYNGYGQTNVPPDLTNAVMLAGGGNHSLALRSDGSLAAWGWNHVGQSAIPDGVSNVVAISAGYYHNLALRNDGTVTGWGNNADGQTNVPPALTNVVGVAAGSYHSLALLRNGTVVGWGNNSTGQITMPVGLSNAVAIQARNNQSAALRSDGSVVVWGDNYNQQTLIPPGVSNVAVLASGSGHLLAVAPTRAPLVQPQSVAGVANTDLVIQLSGYDPDNDPLTFTINTLPAAGALYQYAAGVRGVAITNAGTLVNDAGGRVIFAPAPDGIGNSYANFNCSASDNELVSAPASVTISIFGPLFAFTRPATEISGTAAMLNGFVAPNGFAATAWFEWGPNTSYGLTTAALDAGFGLGVTHLSKIITGLAGGQVIHFRLAASNASQIIFGADQQFVSAGKVSAWGDNSSGQSALPPNLGAVGSVAGGLSHSLSLRTDGTVKAWGNNMHGQTNIPAGLSGVAAIAAGGFHNLALRTNGSVVAWGRNNFAQTNVLASASNVVALAAGGQHSVVLRADGSLVAWGDNSQGQRVVPAGLSNVVGIAAGWYHNVALRGDSTVAAWGANTYGQSTVPAGLTNVVWVGAGLYHSLALRSDGTMAAWGLNSSGQGAVPVAMTNIVAAAGGGSHNLVLRSDNAFTGWGYNFFGQAAPPASLSNVVNFAAGGSHSLALVPNHPPVTFDQTVTGYPNTDLLITLTGSDADNDLLSYRITTLPGQGTIYQFNGGGRGAQILAAGTSVSDANGRVIFAPAANLTGSPHAQSGFVASDGAADSAPAQVTINIVLPAAPSLNVAASGVITNGAFQLAFTGATGATYRVWASTNLLNWELLGTAGSPLPGQFMFLDGSATNWPQRFYRATAP